MKQLRLLAPFLLLSLLVLVWNFPVYALAGTISTATKGRLQVLNSSGSLWAGHLQIGISDGSRVYAVPEPLRWKLALYSQGFWAALRIEHANLVQALHLGFTGGSITVSGGELRMPASWLGAAGAPFNTIRPEGLLQLSWAQWKQGEPLQLLLKWQDAQSALSSIRPLGEYMLSIGGNPQTGLNLNLSTGKGPLTLEGTGVWTTSRGFEFNGYASSDVRSREALTGLLSQMGRQEGERYRLGLF